jgi:F-type H+-transporting ATPase subunit epsilon
MKQYNLEIITPRGIFYEGDASIITLKISEGYVGLMADRMPLMSSVKISKFTMRKDDKGEEKVGVIGNGIVKTEKDQVTIIVNDVI